jgi:GAF domain-containing protein
MVAAHTQRPPAPGAPTDEDVPMTQVDERLRAVRRYEILDAPPDGAFDRVARIAATVAGTPIATVTIVDEDRVWFAATEGLTGVTQVGTEPGLCVSAVLADGPYLVGDAAADPRTMHHPLVRGELGLRFYAAAPIVSADGHRLGTVNVMDREPRSLTDSQTAVLTELARVVMDQLEVRLASLRAVRAERGRREASDRHAAALTARLQAAASAAAQNGDRPASCELGGSQGCTRPAELKVADSWGVSAWGCALHAEEVIVTVSNVFIADEALGGLSDYLTR